MRTILASIKPQPLSKICNFEKLWEVRKHSPTAGPPFRVLCCESGSHGMIKASFVCDKVIKKYPKEALAELGESCVPYENAVAYADGGRLHFWQCSISDAILDDGIETIGYLAFAENPLKSVALPKSLNMAFVDQNWEPVRIIYK